MLRQSRSRKTPELGLRQIDEGWEILVLEMIVVTRAYSADFELPRNLLALCVCLVITPGESFVATVRSVISLGRNLESKVGPGANSH